MLTKNPRREQRAHFAIGLLLLGGAIGYACSSDSSNPSEGTTQGTAQGTTTSGPGTTGPATTTGSGGAPATSSSVSTSSSGTGGSAGSGGSGTGGATSGSGTGGAGGNAGSTGGSGTGGGGAGGGKLCAGNAISLSANGTGMASDAARARVEASLGADLPSGNADRTIEFWAFIKTTDWVGEKNEVFVYGNPGSMATAFGLDFGTNPVAGMPTNHATLNPYTNGGFNVDSTANLGIDSSKDQWVHIAMTWDGTTMRTYVNGTSRIMSTGSNGITKLMTGDTPITIGCNPPIFNCFNGYFDEFRVWKIARTEPEIMSTYNKTLAGNETGLVAYWKFDEASGMSVADSVTSAGHTAHIATLMATSANQLPTFVAPAVPVPLMCP